MSGTGRSNAIFREPFIMELTGPEKHFYVQIITDPNVDDYGNVRVDLKSLADELGYNLKTINALLKRFEKSGRLSYSRETGNIKINDWKVGNHGGQQTLLLFETEG